MKKVLFILVSILYSNLSFSQDSIIVKQKPLPNLNLFDKKLQEQRIAEYEKDLEYRKAFSFNENGFVNAKTGKAYTVLLFEGKDINEIKNAVLAACSSIYKSPGDVIRELGSSIISLDGYAEEVYHTDLGNEYCPCDFTYNMTIEIKDGKVKFNAPKIKQIYANTRIIGTVKLGMQRNISEIIKKETERYFVLEYFNKIIETISKEIKRSEDW